MVVVNDTTPETVCVSVAAPYSKAASSVRAYGSKGVTASLYFCP